VQEQRWAPYCVQFQDLNFERRLVEYSRPDGSFCSKWVPVGMPRIDPQWVKTVFYLFRRNPESGEIDKDPSGTGFFVLRSSTELAGYSHWYAVSNWHVTHDLGASIIRINALHGNHRFIEFDPIEWLFERDGDDLSIIDVTENLQGSLAEAWVVDERNFISKERYDDLMIDIGEDTIMVGLFSAHHGGERNIPSARFGNISMMPSDKALVKQPNHVQRPSYLVDTRSRGGYSGSPVFVYRTPDADIRRGIRPLPLTQQNVLFALLGVHCGQFWEPVKVRKAPKRAEAVGVPILEGDDLRIEGGMTIVIPAWEISSLLDREELEMKRKDRDKKRRGSWERLPVPEAEGEAVSPPANDVNPKHREDFKSLLHAAVQKRESED